MCHCQHHHWRIWERNGRPWEHAPKLISTSECDPNLVIALSPHVTLCVGHRGGLSHNGAWPRLPGKNPAVIGPSTGPTQPAYSSLENQLMLELSSEFCYSEARTAEAPLRETNFGLSIRDVPGPSARLCFSPPGSWG